MTIAYKLRITQYIGTDNGSYIPQQYSKKSENSTDQKVKDLLMTNIFSEKSMGFALKYITILAVNLSQVMKPHQCERTPEKAKPLRMEFIRTPQIDKEENLYEMLIKSSPPRVLFPSANNQSDSHDQLDHYQNSFSHSESSDALGEEHVPGQHPPKHDGEPEIVIHHATPLKPTRVSKGCHCEKSHCQQKYCDCYKAGELCSEDCACVGCENHHMTANHRQLQKLAELTRSGKGGKELKCNCKKSHCLKNYCDCHNAGRTCSAACNCLQCNNRGTVSKQTQDRKRRHSGYVSDWSSKENILFN